MSHSLLDVSVKDGRLALAAGGAWTADHAADLERLVEAAIARSPQAAAINIDRIVAWLDERPRAMTRISRFAALAPANAYNPGKAAA